jgi:hypothetical protein
MVDNNITEAEGKKVWEESRRADLAMQKKLGNLPENFDVEKAAKGQKAKQAADDSEKKTVEKESSSRRY